MNDAKKVLALSAAALVGGFMALNTKKTKYASEQRQFMARGRQIQGQIPQRVSFAPFLKPSQFEAFLSKGAGQVSISERESLDAQREEFRKVYYRELYAYLKDKIPSVSEDEFLWLGMNGRWEYYGDRNTSRDIDEMVKIMMAGGSQFIYNQQIVLLDETMFLNNIHRYIGSHSYRRQDRSTTSVSERAIRNPKTDERTNLIRYETLKSLLSVDDKNMVNSAFGIESFLGLKAWLVQNPDVKAFTYKGNPYRKQLANPEFRFFDDVNDAYDYAGERNDRLNVRTDRGAEYQSGQVLPVEYCDALINAMVDRTPDNFWDGFAEKLKMAYVKGNLTEKEEKMAQKQQDASFASRVLGVNKNPLTMKYTPNGLKSDLSNDDSRRVLMMKNEILRGKEIPTGPLFLVYDAIAWEIWAEEKARYDETLSLLLKTAWTGNYRQKEWSKTE